MTDLVLHAKKNYHILRIKFVIKWLAELKNRGSEYYGINIEGILYMLSLPLTTDSNLYLSINFMYEYLCMSY